MASENTITRYQGVLRLQSDEAIHEFIRAAIFHNRQHPRQAFNLVVAERRRQHSIGWIGWGHSEDRTYGDYSVGYALLPEYWGRGYMTEALRAGLEFMFLSLGAEGITDFCETRNLGSARVMEKQGMKPVLRWSGEAYDGASVEYIRYAIQRSEWLVLNAAHCRDL